MNARRSVSALRRAPVLAAAAAAGALSFGAAEAQAQTRVGFRAELGAGTMFPEWQRATLQFDSLNFQGTGRLFVAPVDWLSVQASVSNWVFLTNASGTDLGHVLGVTGGFRLEPMIGRLGRLFLDANGGVGFTGPFTRFYFDPGLGFELQVARSFSIGPAVRYGHVVQPAAPHAPPAATFLSRLPALTVGPPPTLTSAHPPHRHPDTAVARRVRLP